MSILEPKKKPLMTPQVTFQEKTDSAFSMARSSIKSSVEESDSELPVPTLYAASNNWKGRPMMTIIDFLRLHMGGFFLNEAGLLSKLKDQGRVERWLNLKDLNEEQMGHLNVEYKKYLQEHLDNFEKTALEYCRYDKPHLVNIELARNAIENGETVYVLPMFIEPGKRSMFFT